MIKPMSLPSHFELQAEAQPWNFEGKLAHVLQTPSTR